MTEYGKKLLLSKNEHAYLTECFRNDTALSNNPVIMQINNYFDPDTLSMNR